MLKRGVVEGLGLVILSFLQKWKKNYECTEKINEWEMTFDKFDTFILTATTFVMSAVSYYTKFYMERCNILCGWDLVAHDWESFFFLLDETSCYWQWVFVQPLWRRHSPVSPVHCQKIMVLGLGDGERCRSKMGVLWVTQTQQDNWTKKS